MGAFTIWFTGLSGSGKSTLSRLTYLEIRRRGLKAELLDGDIIRSNFSQELGYTKRDRYINVKRIGFLSWVLNKHDIISIVAAIAPYEEVRQINRRLIPNYIEVYCSCPLNVLKERDPKGLYEKALKGEIPNFTGVSDPYEVPSNPEIVCYTDRESVEESLQKIITYLVKRSLIPEKPLMEDLSLLYEQEKRLRNHLLKLGFAREAW